jgi:hypothetical protein
VNESIGKVGSYIGEGRVTGIALRRPAELSMRIPGSAL